MVAARTTPPSKRVLNWRLLLGVGACALFWVAVIIGVIKIAG
jgi:hypothetical protein